ncbi:hypothetical protein IJ579_07790 [bacterium]|nr:hypothetical protein [bacterium]
MHNKYEQVKKDFLSGQIQGCKRYFEKHNYDIEAAYCNLVEDDLKKSQKLFHSKLDIDPRANWGLSLVQMILQDVKYEPTYFGIRNFLEIDLNILIKYYKGQYIESLIRYSDYMAYINPECYKLIGRGFWANNMLPAAMFFLRRAKDKFYNDPELHYLLAYIFYNENNIIDCKKSLITCLNINPEYYPAVKLGKKLIL